MGDFWARTLWWPTQLGEWLVAQPWVGHLQNSASDAAGWLWGSGTPVVGGLLVLLAGAVVARAIRETSQRKPRPQSYWIADRRGRDAAGGWRPIIALDRARRGVQPSDAVAHIQRPKRA
jgi:hypothetical protein